MHTNCPKCSRKVRKGANYCGFCGFDLHAPILGESIYFPTSQTKVVAETNGKPKKQKKSKQKDRGRAAAKVAIFLLVMVIGLAVLMQYWAEILIMLGQGISQLFAV